MSMDESDPAVEKANSWLALITTMVVPAITVFRLIAPLFRKKK